MQACEGFLIPVQVRSQKKSFLSRRALPWISEQNVFLLFSPFDDVEDPIQTPFVPHSLHVWSHVLMVDRRRLSDHANGLRGVLFDVLVGAWIDEIDLQIRGSIFGDTRGCKIPSIDIILTQVVYFFNSSMECF